MSWAGQVCKQCVTDTRGQHVGVRPGCREESRGGNLKKIPPQKYLVLIPRTCDHYMAKGGRGLTNVIKDRKRRCCK